ncbi:MAG: hypothetical protein WBH90_02215 [Aggregatilineales bacterium]|nr:hypothetical protein [Chloroflexota bacterium]HOA23233.1 hypothetical protein [Aggregatilineales bacterium]HPV06566.1 hypothetical protein [Aggregatilineales bacterium]
MHKPNILRQRFILIALIVVMALALTACGAGKQQNVEPPAAEPVSEDVETPAEEAAEPAEPEAEPVVEEEAPAEEAAEPAEEEAEPAASETVIFKGLDAAELASYVADITFDFEGVTASGDPVSMRQVMKMSVQQDPLLMAMTIEGVEGEGVDLSEMGMDAGSMTFFVSDTTVSMQMGDMCLAFPVDENDPASQEMFGDAFIDPEDLVDPGSETPELTFVGVEEVNGQRARHYRMTNANLDNFQDATMDVWLVDSPAGEYATRIEITGKVVDEEYVYGDAVDGQMSMVMNITNVNEPVDITLPANCQEFTIPEMP